MKKVFGIVAFCALIFCGTAAGQEFGPWSTPVSLGPTINSKCNDQHPALSKDGLTLVFASNRPANPTDPCVPALHLWVTQRDTLDSAWQTPQPLSMLNTPLSSTYEDSAANFSTDGHWLFFHSARSEESCNGGGRLELMAAHRKDKRDDFGWEPPINLGCTLNTTGADNAGPTFWEDDATGTLYLYLTRNNTPANPNGFNIYLTTCSADLDSCNRQQLWSAGEYVAELNSPGFRNTRTAIRRRDGLEMLITSNRPGTTGNLDLWVSTRNSAQDPWSLAIDLNGDNVNKGGDAALNSSANDAAPALSWDGQTMIFYSNKAGGVGGNDLYVCTRQKFAEP